MHLNTSPERDSVYREILSLEERVNYLEKLVGIQTNTSRGTVLQQVEELKRKLGMDNVDEGFVQSPSSESEVKLVDERLEEILNKYKELSELFEYSFYKTYVEEPDKVKYHEMFSNTQRQISLVNSISERSGSLVKVQSNAFTSLSGILHKLAAKYTLK